MWPPSSPDLNPLDYSVWNQVVSKACRVTHLNVESLKDTVRQVWASLSRQYIHDICAVFEGRVKQVALSDGHIIS